MSHKKLSLLGSLKYVPSDGVLDCSMKTGIWLLLAFPCCDQIWYFLKLSPSVVL